MEFRWISLIALWTLISGPILGVPTGSESSAKVVAVKALQARK
jgi:hypothetical protein